MTTATYTLSQRVRDLDAPERVGIIVDITHIDCGYVDVRWPDGTTTMHTDNLGAA